MGDIQTEFERARAWALDLGGAPQKALWSALALAAGYLMGWIVAFLVRRALARLIHISKRREGRSESEQTDTVMLGIVGSGIRLAFLLGGGAVAAHLFDLYPITNSASVSLNALKAFAIFVAVWAGGSILAGRVRNIGRADPSAASERTLLAFLSSVIQFAAIAVGLVGALQVFGFPTASLVAVLGAAGLAIALSLQDTLKAVAAGVVIAIFRPYRLGDYVTVAGEAGVVAEITPFTTALDTIDNRRIVITNDKAWGSTIQNFSSPTLRKLNVTIGISYDDSIAAAMSIIEQILRADSRVLPDRPLWIKVTALNTSSVDITFRAWCETRDHFDLQCDMLKAVKEGFDAAGITIPYPHQVEVLKEMASAPRAAPPSAASDTH